ncbi:DUF3857 domain-containing protein [Flavobacterium sp. NRK F10]|uniref:DUF3857 domain-containing protein n=1 Tax=Flavobacterium sp. NRK F10 TaxID=2954931 RepID=UPI0020919694|nr:DUF3857 domain-containing protein [Flavobacterium sp. NRK F10]MCO6174371.1 DUF3857 domain-containing protein [Flavobacterium sp. NRK F10]
MIKYLFILIGLMGYSQDYELGEVTVEELSRKNHLTDSTASASYMFKKGLTEFILYREGNWEIVTKVEVKIKIYKKEGLDFANQEILYFSGHNSERINITEANTYNLVDGKVVKTKVRSDSEFKEEINDRWSKKKLAFPDVKVGSIIEYSYKITSPYISNFDDWYFQYDIPVDFVEYMVYIPEFFSYRTLMTGYENIALEEKTVRSTDFNKLKHTYTGKNIPAIKEEKFVRNIDNYTSKISFELARISYPNQAPKEVATTWKSVVKTIYDEIRFGKEIKQKRYFEEDLEAIIKGLSEDEKLEAIFKFVQNRMNWNEKNGYLVDNGVKKAYKEKIGNVADINLMLVAMLQYAGFDANPVLLSTRSNGIALFPSRFAFNYVIAGVQKGDEVILLDATNKNTEQNIIPIKAINWFGRLIRANGTMEDIVLESNMRSIQASTLMVEMDEEGTIKGKYREQLTNYEAFVFAERFADKAEDVVRKNTENEYDNIEISEFEVNDDKPKNVIVNFELESSNLVDQIGNKMYLSPMMFLKMDENPFKDSERKFPIEVNYPFKENYNIVIKLPEGFEIEYLPEAVSYVTEGGEILFTYQIANPTPNSIQMVSTLEFRSSIVPVHNYQSLKTFFDELLKKTDEKIVLKQKI